MPQQNDGSDEHQHASNKGDPQSTPSILHTGIVGNPPPSLNENENTSSKDRDRLEYKRFVVECVTLSVLIIYAAITFLMYCANKKSADAAYSAAGIRVQSP